MRGFPLFNTLVVAAIFFLTWWPLRQLATSTDGNHSETSDAHAHAHEGHDHKHDDGKPENLAADPLEIRIFASAPIEQLRIEHLGEIVTDQSGVTGEWSQAIEGIAIPPEGIDFWVEAEFAEDKTDGRLALGIEVTPSDRDSVTRTLWTDGTTIADSVLFLWEE